MYVDEVVPLTPILPYYLHEEEYKVMHIGGNNPGYEYHLGTTPLKETAEEKELGPSPITSSTKHNLKDALPDK